MKKMHIIQTGVIERLMSPCIGPYTYSPEIQSKNQGTEQGDIIDYLFFYTLVHIYQL